MPAVNAPHSSLLPTSSARSGEVAQLRELADLLERGEDTLFASRFAALLQARDQGLFVSVARLTRELHDALRSLRFDEQLSSVAGEIPDACARLDHVARITEEAAHHTLDLVEHCQGLTQALADQGVALAREHAAQAQPILAHTSALRTQLTQLAQAQEYQDLAGQVLKRVTAMVKRVETALLDLLRAAGTPAATRGAEPANGLQGPAVAGVTPAAVSQDDADSLLAELGF